MLIVVIFIPQVTKFKIQTWLKEGSDVGKQ